MKSLHPQFFVRKFDSQKASWIGIIQPDPLSDTYEVEIRYELGDGPTIKILKPDLQLVPGAKQLPHTYEEDALCLYYPKTREWHSRLLIADYIVPWISLWLFYYEMWLAKGKWLGGGTNHSPRN